MKSIILCLITDFELSINQIEKNCFFSLMLYRTKSLAIFYLLVSHNLLRTINHSVYYSGELKLLLTELHKKKTNTYGKLFHKIVQTKIKCIFIISSFFYLFFSINGKIFNAVSFLFDSILISFLVR